MYTVIGMVHCYTVPYRVSKLKQKKLAIFVIYFTSGTDATGFLALFISVVPVPVHCTNVQAVLVQPEVFFIISFHKASMKMFIILSLNHVMLPKP